MENLEKLKEKLPDWAVKPHPTKTGMSVIHPMAVVDRLNEVFGLGKWNTNVEKLSSARWSQKTSKGEREVYTSTSKVTLLVPSLGIHLEQFGGSTNDDEGDALKGSATDGLTKIASYLGIGAEIYKGNGNVSAGVKKPPVKPQDALELAKRALEEADTVQGIKLVIKQITASKNLMPEDKEELLKGANLKLDSMDPTK